MYCILCAIRAQPPKQASQMILHYFKEIIEAENLSAEEAANVLIITVGYWTKNHLDIRILEDQVLLNIPQLAPGLKLLMDRENSPKLPFSPKVFLAVTRHCLSLFSSSEKTTPVVSAGAIWSQVRSNIEKESENSDRISISRELLRSINMPDSELRNYRNQQWKDTVVFSCGHSFNIKDFYENRLTDFHNKVSKSSLPQTGKLVWEDFSQKFISNACPSCSYTALLSHTR